MGEWLKGAQATPDGLVIPGAPEHQGATICLGPEQVTLSLREATSVLPWSACNSKSTDTAAGWDIGTWRWVISRFGSRRYGIALNARGDVLDALKPVLRVSKTFRNRLYVISSFGIPNFGSVRRVPLAPQLSARERERITFWILCRLLAERQELRLRLSDEGRMRTLARDIGQRATTGAVMMGGLRRARYEVETAMTHLGLAYRFGRPIPGDLVMPKDEAVAKVIAQIAVNRYEPGRTANPEEVGEILDRLYYQVTPWPFEALTM